MVPEDNDYSANSARVPTEDGRTSLGRHRAPERFIYIAGTSFTGSTLLSFLLNLHPQIVSVGEMTGPFRNWADRRTYPCSCGRALAECPFWRDVGEQMKDRHLIFDPVQWEMRLEPENRFGRRLTTASLRNNRADELRDAVLSRLPWIGARLGSIALRNEALVASVRTVAGKPVFADASKSLNRLRLLDEMTNLDPLLIHIVRDAPGFVASRRSRSERDRRNARLDGSIRYWNRRAQQADLLFAKLPDERSLRLRYEDLCTDPDGCMRRVWDFVGVDRLDGPYDFLAGDHHIIGNRMRLSNSSEIVLDERWRSILSEREVEIVKRKTDRYRRAFGYL